MKILAASLIAALLSAGASAQSIYGYGTGSNPSSHFVQGYTNQFGTYVQPHYQTNPNNTQFDNYNARGNYNPHNGAYGTRSPQW
jgi:hypothetical protein